MPRILKMIVTSLLAAAILCGCGDLIQNPFAGGPKASPQDESFADFMDVPYPAHMNLEKKAGFTYSRRDVIAGVVSVSGKFNIEEVGAYYDLHLPPHGWAPVAEAQTETLVSTWKKDNRLLTIIARPAGGFSGGVNVELWVAPPHVQSDLGQRAIYMKPTQGEDTYSPSSEPGASGAPGYNRKVVDGVSEEDI